MKTLCALDNVACLVSNMGNSLELPILGFVVIGMSLGIAALIASIGKGN